MSHLETGLLSQVHPIPSEKETSGRIMIRKGVIIAIVLSCAALAAANDPSEAGCDYSVSWSYSDPTNHPRPKPYSKNSFDKDELEKVEHVSISRRTQSNYEKERTFSEHFSMSLNHKDRSSTIRYSQTEDLHFDAVVCERKNDRTLYQELMSILSKTRVKEGCGRNFREPASLSKEGWQPFSISISLSSSNQVEYFGMSKDAQSDFIRLLERESSPSSCSRPATGPLSNLANLDRIDSVLFLFNDRVSIRVMFADDIKGGIFLDYISSVDGSAKELTFKPGLGPILRKELAEARLEKSNSQPSTKDTVRVLFSGGSAPGGLAYQGPSSLGLRLIGLKEIFKVVQNRKSKGFDWVDPSPEKPIYPEKR